MKRPLPLVIIPQAAEMIRVAQYDEARLSIQTSRVRSPRWKKIFVFIFTCKIQLIIGSPDNEIRIFKDDLMRKEIMETDAVLRLATVGTYAIHFLFLK